MVISPLAVWLILTGHNSASSTQKFKFRPTRNEPLDSIEHFNHMPAVPRHQPYTYRGAAMQFL